MERKYYKDIRVWDIIEYPNYRAVNIVSKEKNIILSINLEYNSAHFLNTIIKIITTWWIINIEWTGDSIISNDIKFLSISIPYENTKIN